jgi:hypothetical protein
MKMSVRPFFVLCVMSSMLASCAIKGPSSKEGAAASSVIEAAKDEAYTKKLQFQDYNCEILVPAHYSLAETDSPVGKLFTFSGPKHADGKSAELNLKFIKNPEGEPIQPVQSMLDSVLQPYSEQLAHYTQTADPPSAVNGHNYQGARFTGESGSTPASGFAFATEVENNFFILYGEDTKPTSQSSIPEMLKSVGTFKIGSAAK